MDFVLSQLGATLPKSTSEKFNDLNATLVRLLTDGLIIAFSGGVDSAFLLWAAESQRKRSGGKLLALTAVSASMAVQERDDAKMFADELGVEHSWEESHELENPAYLVNDTNRCYHCKSELFRIGHDIAEKRGYRWLAYGYNASDRGDVRPGHKAALENEVLSPLADAELTKDDIRIIMRAYGLALSEKPASPCLSSRLMHGVAVSPEKLQHVETLEAIMREAGVQVFRVRLHEEGSRKFFRIEVAPEEITKALPIRERLVETGKSLGYHWVLLDLAGYKMGGGRL